MSQYTERRRQRQLEKFAGSLWTAEQAAKERARVVLKTYATNEIRLTFSSGAGFAGGSQAKDKAADGFPPAGNILVYSDKPQHSTTESMVRPSKKRSGSLSRYGKHTIREGCAVQEDIYGRSVAFLTLTLPGSTPEAKRTLADNSRGILNAFMQRLRHTHKTYIDGSEPIDYVAVWEYQERGALHLHLSVGIKDKSHYQKVKRNTRKWWRQVLETYSDSTGVDLFAQAEGGTHRGISWLPKTECKRVKKSIGRYMSKYLSKGPGGTIGVECIPPSRWWSVSKSIMSQVVARREAVVVVEPSHEVAKEKWLKVAQLAGDWAETTYCMRNPVTQQVTGYVFYFNDGIERGVYEHLAALLLEENGNDTLAKMSYEPHGPPDIHGEIYAA